MGLRHTVKRWRSQRAASDSEDGWRHVSIVLEPLNRDFEDIVLEEGQAARAVAEFVEVLQG